MMNEVDSKSNNWQQALEIFLDKWRDLDYVEGVLVTGSQVVGTATQNSDVDVHIILSPNIDWRERGNELVNDTLIEYFANPVFFFQQYLDEDYANNSKQNARMFVIGKILFDKNGEVAKLVSQAKTYMEREFTKPDDIWTNVAKYAIWDEFDGLDDIYSAKQPAFEHSYHLFLQNLLIKYAKFMGAEILAHSKLYKFLSSEDFRLRYKIEQLPDNDFNAQFLQALQHKSQDNMYSSAKALTQLVLDKMGGFEIDGWKLRTPATGESRRMKHMS
jgi:predicted nucleotidyltransferase